MLQDETRTVEIHHIMGLPHADGMLMVYLPKEKILAYADMFNLPPADNPVPNPPVVGHAGVPREPRAAEARARADHVGALARTPIGSRRRRTSKSLGKSLERR